MQNLQVKTSTIVRRVNKAIEDPRKALDQGWYQDKEFCQGFFDQCENISMTTSPRSCSLARDAVKIAVANGDECLINASESLVAQAYLATGDGFWAGRLLEKNRQAALGCCSGCSSDFFCRQGDILAEEKNTEESLRALNRCLDEGGDDLVGDPLGRVLLPRSVAYHFGGQREKALADASQVLELISLDSPRGFFLDTAACMGVYIGGGDPCHDTFVLEALERFLVRIQSLEWKDARTRVFWVIGHLHARLGNLKRAFEVLEVACYRLLADGLPREIVAAVLDLVQLKCRPSNLREDNVKAAIGWLNRCFDQREDLEDDQRRGLNEILKVFDRSPEAVFAEVGDFRGSFVAPVPGLLGERIGPE